ncbi:hypothetical protein ACIBSV_46840 [Embleya sp. NPDC050154]|uniref:hypothetical protein n=1 Tax=Embleya sp. NPDC050154 TaxID=3363988 RepID=UPI0037B0E619
MDIPLTATVPAGAGTIDDLVKTLKTIIKAGAPGTAHYEFTKVTGNSYTLTITWTATVADAT